jgi:hypothetical protein
VFSATRARNKAGRLGDGLDPGRISRVPFPAREQAFLRRKDRCKDASGFVESRLASGCGAAWVLVFARARVAGSALGAVFEAHQVFSS